MNFLRNVVGGMVGVEAQRVQQSQRVAVQEGRPVANRGVVDLARAGDNRDAGEQQNDGGDEMEGAEEEAAEMSEGEESEYSGGDMSEESDNDYQAVLQQQRPMGTPVRAGVIELSSDSEDDEEEDASVQRQSSPSPSPPLGAGHQVATPYRPRALDKARVMPKKRAPAAVQKKAPKATVKKIKDNKKINKKKQPEIGCNGGEVVKQFHGRKLPPGAYAECTAAGKFQFMVKKVTDSQMYRGREQLEVEWAGYGGAKSWMDLSELTECQELVDAYKAKK